MDYRRYGQSWAKSSLVEYSTSFTVKRLALSKVESLSDLDAALAGEVIRQIPYLLIATRGLNGYVYASRLHNLVINMLRAT